MKKWMIGMAAGLLLIAGCGNGEEEEQNTAVPEIVDAKIIIPEMVESNEETPLQVRLTQGGEPVNDANEVVFELWNDVNGGESDMIPAVRKGDGVYQINMMFEEDGVYSLQTHVTARDMHVMPKKQFTVGEVTEEQLEKANENIQNQESNHMEGEHDDQGDHEH
ncbi:FixH family protein [Jeotgalibacillus soli]|uniref:YtkA-like domain-containing protein n=1 Tax=Jeotgalibacillus soli TaxID=889306 RepID=A0A0C2VQM3_9BACL|nr:FixH family protein [Jeotgalibacillus soli]KIL46746.1 hypothetical protein KP78_18640 [Jeotgalibacillus soli]